MASLAGKAARSRLAPLLWVVAQPADIFVKARPEICIRTLATAAKPSSQRLHLRDMFTGGRRYTVTQTTDGFKLTTTHAIQWQKRRRTQPSAIVHGSFSAINDDITRVHLESRTTWRNMLNALIIPAAVIPLILVTAWWTPLFKGISILAVALGSWIAHRYNASLEAVDMLYFVQKALDDLEAAEILPLSSSVIDISSVQADFAAEWARYVEKQEPHPPD